jgi:hypothetical protein
MSPDEFWWIYDAKRTDQKKGTGLSDDELQELYELIS